MTSAQQPAPEQPADWEAFYSDYRKPGYIDGFEITSKLGGGMFGLVFRARRMSIGKDYAIKFLKVDDGEVRRAVLSELEQVKYFAQIDHPNLVSIEDRGEVSGIPYLVMAYAGAETLRDRLHDRIPTAPEKDELLRSFLQCCRGLQALHERSLVHFDIKPANVFLKGGVARLGDYGLSKLITHSRGSLSMGRGTPYYMAPEMLQRRGDARSDIYSLGIMLYEILCGRVPFTGDSEWEVLRKHETAQPELLDHLSAVERAVLQRCLAKDPAQRFQSVHDLIVAFGAATTPGAATWDDVRDGASVGVEPPPPSSSSLPPPPPRVSASGALGAAEQSSHDAYAAMAKASREAFKQANVAARHAMRDARKVARVAARKAREAWRQSLGKSRSFSVRRWRVLKRLREQKIGDKARAQAQKVASGIANAFKPRSSFRRFLVMGTALLVTVGVLFGVWFSMLASGRSFDRQAEASVSVRGAREELRSTFQSFLVPNRYQGHVSTSEPDWAQLYSRSRSQAKTRLLQHIERLRANAPIQPHARRRAGPLPALEHNAADPRPARVRMELEQLLRPSRYDKRALQRFVAKGPLALATVGRVMARLQWTNRDDYERGVRLHNLLVDATGCRDLEVVSWGRSGAADCNRPLGDLWIWFVNEFAHTERAWKVYRKLLRI